MLPILLNLGPIKIYSYGLFLFLGIFAGLYWFWKIGRDEHWDEIALFDGYFISLFWYFFVGRISYTFFNTSFDTWIKIFAILSYPGINIFGGLAGVLIFMILWGRKQSWDMGKMFDVLSVVLSTVLVFASFGALLNGTNPGIESSLGIVHPGDTLKRIPVDLWMWIWSLVSFAIVSRVRKQFRFYSWYKGDASVAKDGLAALTYIALWGGYFLTAGFMDDGARYMRIPVQSITGFWVIIISGCMIYLQSGKNRGEALLNKILRRK